MRTLEAVLLADKEVLMAFVSHLLNPLLPPARLVSSYRALIVHRHKTKNCSGIVTKHRQFRFPSLLLYHEMRSWLLGLKKKTSRGVKTKMRLTLIHIRLIASLPTTSLLLEQDSILVQLGTLGAFRQSKPITL